MATYQQDEEQISDGVNLLISILVHYPEIGTIRFDPQHNSLKLTFMLSGIPSQTEFLAIKQLILDSTDVYHMLEGFAINVLDVQLSEYDQVAILTILRDVHTLSKGEIDLVITLLREQFQGRLVRDQNDSLLVEGVVGQDDLIDNMLENMKLYHAGHGLIGIREDGRVLVFNK